MNFDFSEEQKSLRDEVQKFLRNKSDLTVCRAVLEGEHSYDENLWAAVADLGWPAVALPEEFGGIGLGYLELCVIAEELGRSLTPIPFSSSIYLFAEAMLHGGSEEQKSKWLPQIASGRLVGTFAYSEGHGFPSPETITSTVKDGRLTGKKWPVADGDISDISVVLAKDENNTIGLYIVELNDGGVVRETLKSIDPSRGQASLEFKSVKCEALECSDGWGVFERTMDAASVLFAFEQIGGADECLSAAIKFSKERKAFGRLIGSFQAIKHNLADMYVKNELARSNAYYGAWALSTSSPELPLAASVARVSATDAYNYASKENIQIHGGMGFTWEADCHLYLRRARSLAVNVGGVGLWKQRIARELEKQLD